MPELQPERSGASRTPASGDGPLHASDQLLSELAVHGDQNALDELARRLHPRLRAWLSRTPLVPARVRSDPGMVDDIAMETWQHFIETTRRGTLVQEPWQYLLGIARKRVLRHASPRRRADAEVTAHDPDALERVQAFQVGARGALSSGLPEDDAIRRAESTAYIHFQRMLFAHPAPPNQSLAFAFVKLLQLPPRCLAESSRLTRLEQLYETLLAALVEECYPSPEEATRPLNERLALAVESMGLSTRSMATYGYLSGRCSSETTLDEWFAAPTTDDPEALARAERAVSILSQGTEANSRALLGKGRQMIAALRPYLDSARSPDVLEAYIRLCAGELSAWCDTLGAAVRAKAMGLLARWEGGEPVAPEVAEMCEMLPLSLAKGLRDSRDIPACTHRGGGITND